MADRTDPKVSETPFMDLCQDRCQVEKASRPSKRSLLKPVVDKCYASEHGHCQSMDTNDNFSVTPSKRFGRALPWESLLKLPRDQASIGNSQHLCNGIAQ